MNGGNRRSFLERLTHSALGLYGCVLMTGTADGERAEGVVTQVILPKRVFAEGEPIPSSYKITNRTRKPITYWSAGWWVNHRLEVLDSRGVEASPTAAGEIVRRAFAPYGPRRKNFPVVLKPGESLTEGDGNGNGLDAYYVLKPGTYAVRVTYDDPSEPTPLRLVTPEVKFTVAPKDALKVDKKGS